MKPETRIAILGANGQLGSELVALLGPRALPLARPRVDVRDPAGVRAALRELRPDVVINCVAQTQVDRCENEPEEAFAVNAIGALHVARAAESCAARLVYVSTDYVFGARRSERSRLDCDSVHPLEARPGPGLETGPGTRFASDPGVWFESDLPEPCNVYGASKLAGEHLTLANHAHALVVRTSGLYGHAGARGKGGNFVETMLRLDQEGRPLRVVGDQRLSPTSASHCARRIIDLVQRGANGVCHVAARDSCTWHEFAQAIFELRGLPRAVACITTREFAAQAPRPACSALGSERLAALGISPGATWREMLREYLDARRAARVVRKEGALT